MFRLLVQSCCGEGGALQTNVTGVCGEPSQCSGQSGFAPANGLCASPSTLLRLQAALQGAALHYVHFPGPSRSGSGSWVLHKGADSVGPAFCTFQGLSSSGNQELDKRDFSPPCPSLSFWVRWSGVPCFSSGELISGCDPPSGCQPSIISGSLWFETGSLFAVW